MPRVYIIRKGYYGFNHSQGNFSGGGSQNAIWSGSQSNVGPQDRIFAGNYASGMQGNCPDGYEETANGGCVEIGLGDPSREQGCPRGQYRDRNGKCRSMQPGTYNAKTKRPPINPFAPTTLPYDPMGAKQIGGACGQGLCGTPPNCRPCGSTGPTYPQKQVANPGCNPPCGKGEYCQGGQCYSGQPSARQNIISRCDTYNPNCPGPRSSANYRSKSGQCCSKGALRQTSPRRRR